MTTFDHTHAHVRLRLPMLAGLLRVLHLPFMWLVTVGTDPHHPDCTPTEAVLEQR